MDLEDAAPAGLSPSARPAIRILKSGRRVEAFMNDHVNVLSAKKLDPENSSNQLQDSRQPPAFLSQH